MVAVSRVVVELNPKFHPTGGRFLVKDYPKDQEHRQIALSRHILSRLRDQSAHKEPEDLLFTLEPPTAPRRRVPKTLPDPEILGLTEPNEAGRRYRHGTLTAYSAGRCRCRHCRDACASYRAARRGAGKDSPRAVRTVDTDGHIPRDWFRRQVWIPSVAAAGIGLHVRVHDLRHAHASWLLRWRRGPSGGEGTTRPCEHHHDRKVSPYSSWRPGRGGQRP